MSRPADWSPLDRGSDPAPGDPDGVARASRHYRAVAEAIATASDGLRQIAAGTSMESEAVETFVDKADEVARDVSRAYERYDGVADALATYAPLLDDAQHEADRALRDAERARDEIAAAERRLDDAHDDLGRATEREAQTARDSAAAGMPAPPSDLGAYRAGIRAAEGALESAQDELARAKRRADDAEESARSAADRARRSIEDVLETGGLKDSRWDDVASVVKKVADIAGMVAAACGVAALLVGWIPVIGQALAAVLGAIALVAGAIALIANLSLAIGGKGSWGAVALDAFGLATFGLGRAVAGGARAAYRGSQAMARLDAGRLAALAPALRTARGLPGGSSMTAMRSMLGTSGRVMSRGQARSGLRQARAVPTVSPSSVFRSVRNEVFSAPANLRTVLDAGNLRRAAADSPEAWRQLTSSAGGREFMARLTQDADSLRHLDFTRAVDPAVQTGDMFARASRLNGVEVGSVLTAGTLDSYQFSTSDLWPGGKPADRLDLAESR